MNEPQMNNMPIWAGPFIGYHDVITAWCSDAFYIMDPTLRTSGAQTAYTKGRRGRLPGPVGLGNQGLVQ